MAGEQPFSAPAQPAAQPAQAQPVEPQYVPTQPSAPAEPEQMKDRTRENFEKLLDSNQRLYEQNEILRQEIHQRLGQAAPQAQPQPAQPQAQPQSEWDFYEVDPKTGETYINRDRLNRTMKDIQERARRAEVTVQSYVKTAEEREIERQNQETYASYPELNPKGEKFDKQFHLQVQGLLYSSFIGPDQFGGKPLTFKEAASLVRGGQPAQPQGEPAPAPQPGAGEALKEAGAAQVSSQPQNPSAPTDDAELIALRFATRMGNDRALAERLIHTEHILPAGAREVDA